MVFELLISDCYRLKNVVFEIEKNLSVDLSKAYPSDIRYATHRRKMPTSDLFRFEKFQKSFGRKIGQRTECSSKDF